MKNKGIVIELTALLDVILIMLFWVMMNIQEQTNTVRAETDAQIAEYQEQYEALQAEFDKLNESFSQQVSADENQQALYDYQQGNIITLNLRYDAVGKLFILDSEGELGHSLLDSSDEIAASISLSLKSANLEPDDIILCALIYDGDRALYRDIKTISAAIEQVGKDYRYFYCTFINTSR